MVEQDARVLGRSLQRVHRAVEVALDATVLGRSQSLSGEHTSPVQVLFRGFQIISTF